MMPAKHVLGDVCDVQRRSDVFHIDPELIQVVNGWNARFNFDGEDELVASIRERGVLKPLLVRKTEDKRLELVDGERRLRAALRARAEGAEIASVPVMVARRGTNDAELFVDSIVSNQGKPFTPTEEAAAFKRLKAWGLEVKTIALKTGKSASHIRNRLELAEASPDVQAAVDAGEITIGQAQEIVKQSDGRLDRQGQGLDQAKSRPRQRKLVLSFTKSGALRKTGFDGECKPLADIFESPNLLDAIRSAGFDPDSIRVSIKPAAPSIDPNQMEMFVED